jgi:hypothetical protein
LKKRLKSCKFANLKLSLIINNKKKSECKSELSSEQPDHNKLTRKDSENIIIDIEDTPQILPKKIDKNTVKYNNTTSKTFRKVDKNFNDSRNHFDDRTTTDEKPNISKESNSSKNKFNVGFVKVLEDKESATRPHSFQSHNIRNDNLIKRPMNISKPDPVFNFPKQGSCVLPDPAMGYKMTAEPAIHKQMNEYEGATHAGPYNRDDYYNSWPEK